MSKKSIILSSAILAAGGLLGILLTQVFTGSDPIAPLMFLLMLLVGGGLQAITRVCFKRPILQFLPMALSAVWSLWGTYLYLFSADWANTAWFGMVSSYVSPVCGCLLVAALCRKYE